MTAQPRLPQPLTPQSLVGLMREPAYWNSRDPQFPTYQRLVKRGFEILYPGPVRRSDTGNMIDTPPLPPERVAHLVDQTNREMAGMDEGLNQETGSDKTHDGMVHVESHVRDGGKTEVSDYWRNPPGHSAGESAADHGDGADESVPENQNDPNQDTLPGQSGEGDVAEAKTKSFDPDQLGQDSPLAPEFRDGLSKAEESFDKKHGGYEERTPDGKALGRYQLAKDSLVDAVFKDKETGEWTEKARDLGVRDDDDFPRNPKAQEKALADSTAKKDEFLQRNGAKERLGQKIDGIKAEFEITEAGLAAAAHREGAFAVKQYLDHQEQHGWKSDFSSLPEKKREIFEHIETRLREFRDVPYRRSANQ